MSEHLRNGVVDANCKVHERRIYLAAGSSVFPTCGYAATRPDHRRFGVPASRALAEAVLLRCRKVFISPILANFSQNVPVSQPGWR